MSSAPCAASSSSASTVVIANPQAQNGALGRQWEAIRQRIEDRLGPCQCLLTQGPGDASSLAAKAITAGAQTILAMGGDGTINEVINGFPIEASSSSPLTLGLLPFGTGGDFRKSLNIPADLDQALTIIQEGQSRSIDIGKVEFLSHKDEALSRYFVNIASVGLSARVAQRANQSSKALGGRVTYLLASIWETLRDRPQNIRVSWNENGTRKQLDLNLRILAVANGQFFGGGMHFAPEADLGDKKFDVIGVENQGLCSFLSHGTKFLNGSHIDLPEVRWMKSDTLTVEPLTPEVPIIELDGETPGKLPARFSVIPAALRILAPAKQSETS